MFKKCLYHEKGSNPEINKRKNILVPNYPCFFLNYFLRNIKKFHANPLIWNLRQPHDDQKTPSRDAGEEKTPKMI